MFQGIWIPSYLQSGMVLQQNLPFVLRGYGEPGIHLQITLERAPFDGRPVSPLDKDYGLLFEHQATIDDEGWFEVELPPFAASLDPFTLRIAGPDFVRVFQDILFGEVWISGGQSNMAMTHRQIGVMDQITSLANLFYIRILRQSETGLDAERSSYPPEPAADLAGARWIRGDQPLEIADVSAIAFSFARELHLELRIPIAIVETAADKAPIHAWLPHESLLEKSILERTLAKRDVSLDLAYWNSLTAVYPQTQPGALYNVKIAPLTGLGARGIIWYHGEADYQFPQYYQNALLTLVQTWQQVLIAADPSGLALLIVQLAPYYYGHERFTELAEFNDMLAATRHLLPIPAAVVPIYDLPLDYMAADPAIRHAMRPQTKLPIGQRLKTVASALVYGRKGPRTAPECIDIEVVGNKMLLSFSEIGEGLRLTGEDTRLRGFAICGPDRIFVEAEARILFGVRVLCWHEQITEPHAVTYAFADMNQSSNLISRDQVPVLPLRSDRVPSRYATPMEWAHCESLTVWAAPSPAGIEETGYWPAWQISRGRGELTIDPANKSEGDGSLCFRYTTAENHEAGVEPVLHYASFFPPLDLSDFTALSLEVFNTEEHAKLLRLAIATGDERAPLLTLPERYQVLPVLRWQKFTFQLASVDLRDQVRRLVFLIEDRKKKGSLYLDAIRMVLPEGEG